MKKVLTIIIMSSLFTINAQSAILPSQGLCLENFNYQGEEVEIETIFTYGFLNSFKGISVKYTLQGDLVELNESNGLSCITNERDYTTCSVTDEQNPILKSVGVGFPWGASIILKDGKNYVNWFDSCDEI